MLRIRSRLLCAAALGALLGPAATAQALAAQAASPPAQAQLAFDIDAGDLETALVAYAAQAHRQILFDPAIVAGLRAPAVKGELAPALALERLLAGSGLIAHQSGPNVVVVRLATAIGPQARPILTAGGASAPDPVSPAEAPIQADQTGVDPVAGSAGPTLLDELVITGSLIRGGAPGASPVLQLDRDAVDKGGHATVADMLAALPQNFAGSGTQAASVLGTDPRSTNDLAATGINLRGLGASATLVLVNGRRMGGVGSKGDFADASAIPTSVVERIDVLLDGASALYGSDAVGGVVNVILKRRMDGFETRLRAGTSTRGGGEDLQATQTFGTSWGSGDLVLAYEYEKRFGLRADERDFTASADLRPLGGSDHRSFYSHPGNILVYDAAARAYVAGWAIPAGQDGSGLTPGDFVAGVANLENQRQGGDVLPRDERQTWYASLAQDLGPRVRLLADVRYNVRDNLIHRPSPVSAFTVTRANPFFVSPNGSASHTVGYSFADEIGPSLSYGRAQSLGLSLGAEIELPHAWRADLYAADALELGWRDTEKLVNSGFIREALGAVADDPATAYAAARDGYFNPFGDGGANSPAVMGFIGSGYSKSRTLSSVATFDAKADGPLWSLPAGPLKAAIGVQAREERFKPKAESLISSATPVLSGGETFSRTVEAAFLELRAPLVSPEMGVPFVRRLEASLAGRLERYGDFGRTSNPKVGLIWSPARAWTVRASYGTSFRAPNMPELYQLQNASPVLLGSGANQTLGLVQTGGNRDLSPESATTWSLGVDYRSEAVPGLTASATWFDVTFSDQIGQPILADIPHALSNPAYAPFVDPVNPSDAADLARVKAIMAISTNSNIGLFPADAYQAIIDARYVNTGEVVVRGLDLQAAYGWTRGADRFDLTGSVSYLADYVRRFTPTAEPVQLVDTANQPVDLRAQLAGAWTRGPFGLSASLHYVDDYRDEAGRRIKAWTPLDVQARWSPGDTAGPLKGLSLTLAVSNLLDVDPPFYDSAVGVGYDPANADPLGRYVSLQLTKRW